MTSVTLEIPKKIEKNFSIKNDKKIKIQTLFALFGIDFDYLIKEQKYSQDFLNDVKNDNFSIQNNF